MIREYAMIPLNYFFLKEEGVGLEAKEFYEYLIERCGENRRFVLSDWWQLCKDFQMTRYGVTEEKIEYWDFDLYDTYFDYLKEYGYILVKTINGKVTVIVPKGCYNYFKGKKEVAE